MFTQILWRGTQRKAYRAAAGIQNSQEIYSPAGYTIRNKSLLCKNCWQPYLGLQLGGEVGVLNVAADEQVFPLPLVGVLLLALGEGVVPLERDLGRLHCALSGS